MDEINSNLNGDKSTQSHEEEKLEDIPQDSELIEEIVKEAIENKNNPNYIPHQAKQVDFSLNKNDNKLKMAYKDGACQFYSYLYVIFRDPVLKKNFLPKVLKSDNSYFIKAKVENEDIVFRIPISTIAEEKSKNRGNLFPCDDEYVSALGVYLHSLLFMKCQFIDRLAYQPFFITDAFFDQPVRNVGFGFSLCLCENKDETENSKIETENNKSETKNNKIETENDKCETENGKIETENDKIETENEKCETENDKIETENDKIETENDKIETENGKIETENDKIETENEKCETENGKIETENDKIETKNNKSETENNKSETENENCVEHPIDKDADHFSLSKIYLKSKTNRIFLIDDGSLFIEDTNEHLCGHFIINISVFPKVNMFGHCLTIFFNQGEKQWVVFNSCENENYGEYGEIPLERIKNKFFNGSCIIAGAPNEVLC